MLQGVVKSSIQGGTAYTQGTSRLHLASHELLFQVNSILSALSSFTLYLLNAHSLGVLKTNFIDSLKSTCPQSNFHASSLIRL